jgi:hypothetical protein
MTGKNASSASLGINPNLRRDAVKSDQSIASLELEIADSFAIRLGTNGAPDVGIHVVADESN